MFQAFDANLSMGIYKNLFIKRPKKYTFLHKEVFFDSLQGGKGGHQGHPGRFFHDKVTGVGVISGQMLPCLEDLRIREVTFSMERSKDN